jgi:hypothetical protein
MFREESPLRGTTPRSGLAGCRIVDTIALWAVEKLDRGRPLHRTRIVAGTQRFASQGGVEEDAQN